jgi:signal transduction histidine kinase
VLTIGDNGPGIPEEYIKRVFEKFFRVPKGDIHNIKGYGLGLSFADLVMKLHSGKISVCNKNDGGCEFTLTFRREML